MPNFAANLSMMFTEVDFLDRFAAARTAGFDAVEFLFPYEHPAEVVADRLRASDLSVVLFNLPPGDWAAGERGIAALPGREEEFRASVGTALHYAELLDCPNLHVMAGITELDDRTLDTYLANLRWAVGRAAEAGRQLLIEPLNRHSMPGYLLDSVALAREVLADIKHGNVKLQLDLFHAQQTDGDITHLIGEVIGLVGHVQLASVPDRHEPDHGELHYPWVLRVLDEAGYDGWVGCEYEPAGETTAGLGWLDRYARPAAAGGGPEA